MSLKEMILEEHSLSQCRRIVDHVGTDKRRFAALMRLFFANEYRVAQRAAWPVSKIAGERPAMIRPYLGQMIRQLNSGSVHDAVLRNTVRILQSISIPEKFDGQLMDTCFTFIASPDTAVAIKAFSLTILENLSKKYPEIIPEIKLIIADQWDQETPAFRARAGKILNNIK